MLIPYDNEVIPIAKDLRRNFKDDEPGTGHNGTSSDPLSVHINDGVLRLKPGAGKVGCKPPSPGTDRSGFSHPPKSQPRLTKQEIFVENELLLDSRTINTHLNAHDIEQALKDYTAFNAFFYKSQRDIFDRPDHVALDVPQKTLFKEDPLVEDPLKTNQRYSVGESLRAPRRSALTPKIDSQIPFPETILAEAKASLRWGEVPCWDFTVDGTMQHDVNEEHNVATVSTFRWVNHGEFNVASAIDNLEVFFKHKWNRGSHWRVHSELQQRKFKPGGVTAYVFETCWSIPTRKQPVPSSTGSIFFIMDVCKAKKPEAPVIVSCHYENSPMIFDPLKIQFGAEVLTDIMERKRLLAERLIY